MKMQPQTEPIHNNPPLGLDHPADKNRYLSRTWGAMQQHGQLTGRELAKEVARLEKH